MNADKSVCISGNFANGPISYTCYPTNEFSDKQWLLSVQSVSFNSANDLSATCVITCNFVTSQKRSTSGEVEFYEQPLNTFHLKTSRTSSRGIFRFCIILSVTISFKRVRKKIFL